jgi:hypothetical protein
MAPPSPSALDTLARDCCERVSPSGRSRRRRPAPRRPWRRRAVPFDRVARGGVDAGGLPETVEAIDDPIPGRSPFRLRQARRAALFMSGPTRGRGYRYRVDPGRLAADWDRPTSEARRAASRPRGPTPEPELRGPKSEARSSKSGPRPPDSGPRGRASESGRTAAAIRGLMPLGTFARRTSVADAGRVLSSRKRAATGFRGVASPVPSLPRGRIGPEGCYPLSGDERVRCGNPRDARLSPGSSGRKGVGDDKHALFGFQYLKACYKRL